MIFWTHLPVRQWLHVEQDHTPTLHPHPWVVRNGMFIVARCSKQSEAEGIVRDVELAFARAIARDIVNEETTDMTDLKKLIENAGKKFAEDVVAALRAMQVGDLVDECKAVNPSKTVIPEEVIAKLQAIARRSPSARTKGAPEEEAKPPKTKAQTREGQLAYWAKSERTNRTNAVLPDSSVRSFGRTRDLVYKLRKEGYTVLPLTNLDDISIEQQTSLLASL